MSYYVDFSGSLTLRHPTEKTKIKEIFEDTKKYLDVFHIYYEGSEKPVRVDFDGTSSNYYDDEFKNLINILGCSEADIRFTGEDNSCWRLNLNDEGELVEQGGCTVYIDDDELMFLRDLGYKLKTQDNLATRKPVVWRIQDLYDVLTTEDEADTFHMEIQDEIFSWNEKEDIHGFCEEIIDRFLDQERGEKVFEIFEDRNPCCWQDYADQLSELLDEEITCSYTKQVFEFVPHLYFLTHEAAKEHLERYSYRFKSPRCYCDCSIDTPEIERLLEIIEKISSM
ncbi:MAG: hypothetical protein IJI83_03125 [Oscillospiraceae bacterium]|nr:hypothetical protein [Oscillospiraceae bacterium]